ncbi:MAG: glycosyltransferase family 2 protein [Bacillota bacterium]
MDLVSVIIPTFNRADLIAKAIHSALNQTLAPFEVLVCDDGSTDSSRDMVESIGDPRIRWLEGEHSGLPAVPRNRGIWAAKGEWLAFLDSDDEWLPEKLDKQLAAAKKLNCLAACTNAHAHIPGKGIAGEMSNWPEEIIIFKNLIRNNPVICSSGLVHFSLMENVRGFPETPDLIEDYAFWLRVAAYTDIAFLKEPLLIYCNNPLSSVRSTFPTDIMVQRIGVFTDFLRWVAGRQDGPLLDKFMLRFALAYYVIKGTMHWDIPPCQGEEN